MFPAFFSDVPSITLYDPLAAVLGSSDDGLIEYRYEDAVRLAGHSCPTVAASWLLTRAALRALYPERTAVRGGIRVDFAEALEHGVTGVTAAIVTLLTGASGAGGFKGLAGHFSRRQLLTFGSQGVQNIRFTRTDNGASVEGQVSLASLPGDPQLGILLPRILQGQASAQEQALFGELWQARVRKLLLNHADDPEIIQITAVKG